MIYLGVRLSPQELASREVQSALLELHSSAVVDANSAEADRKAVRALAAKGLDVESGGLGGAAGGPQQAQLPPGRWLFQTHDRPSSSPLSAAGRSEFWSQTAASASSTWSTPVQPT